METWQEKRSMQTMNLRSVFTAEQQRMLERYYDNGMTNQSKSCFQLILQCAQETKLDFSVVRTWVGNKRRKLASKADQNGAAGQGLTNHALTGAAGALMAGPVLTGPVLTTEMAAMRSVQRSPAVTHLLLPTSCPSSSSSPSSCSPLSSGNGNNNNNDVILTGIYSPPRNANRLDPSAHNRTGMKPKPSHPEAEPPLHTRTTLQTDSTSLQSNIISLQRKGPHHATSGSVMYSQIRKPLPARDPVNIPPSWTKQYGTSQQQCWPPPSQSQSVPSSSTAHRSPPPSAPEGSVRIQQVFTLAGFGNGSQRPIQGTSKDSVPRRIRTPDMSECFSIAMETGDVDNEYSREEELANMGAQIQLGRSSNSRGSSTEGSRGSDTGATSWVNNRAMATATGRSPSTAADQSDLFGEKGCQTNRSFLVAASSQSSYPFKLFPQTSPPRMNNFKVTGNVSAPWLISNSRKRTLQDRTQFSDRDLHSLKKYWDNGMTSLGSVCREKISAAATELSVDSEIIKTWIGNRRRKYRLMGIELPPPKGGPPTFPKQTNAESPLPLTSEGEEPKTPELGEDSEQNDVLVCLSEDGARNPCQNESEDGNEEKNGPTPAENLKIEIIDQDDHDDADEIYDEDDDDADVMATDMENLHNLLEFKHEEVQYLERELENQKQKYCDLRTFTKSLLIAVQSNDKDKQQELLASLPHEEDNWVLSPTREDEPSVEMISNHTNSSVSEGVEDAEPL